SLQVYDRWGTQVFLVQDMDPKDEKAGWGGDFKGSPVNPAVFAWWAEVELIDGRVLLLKGDVTVVR
ncbi:MAG TPA: hypothetical protein PKD78_13625, partial [Saprospiraceae bacterium]|nr:hypothetical protein [Saprospiraceae bacterium]